MKYLLDTHILLWWFIDNSHISPPARKIIADPENLVYVSAASLWEIALKKSLGKLDLPENLIDLLHQEHFQELSISPAHAWRIQELPFHHRDPFDRMLIVQCQIERLTILTRDEKFSRYDLSIITA